MIALNKTNRNYFMGIAIVLVILHHFCLRLDGCWHVDTFPFTIFYWGQIGVDIFLFVSAYGCCASWENNSCWQYALHRIKRIYPQYIVFLLIVLLWFFADASILHRLKLAVFSLMGIAPIYRLGVSIEWYIPSLLMMYFCLPLIYMGVKRANRGGAVAFDSNRNSFSSMVTRKTLDLLSIFGKNTSNIMWYRCLYKSQRFSFFNEDVCVSDVIRINYERKYGYPFYDGSPFLCRIINDRIRQIATSEYVYLFRQTFSRDFFRTNYYYSIYDEILLLGRKMVVFSNHYGYNNSADAPILVCANGI